MGSSPGAGYDANRNKRSIRKKVKEENEKDTTQEYLMEGDKI